ncbi:MAG TPA: hypothetical protein VF681_09510 [Abditibacteriaceae bacterium]|jgi:nitrous oxide reductase
MKSSIEPKYLAASGAMVVLLGVVAVASQQGWGLTNEGEALARARNNSGGSVRSGSLHGRHYYGGGGGFGK